MADHEIDIGDDGNGRIKTLPGKLRQADGPAGGKTVEWRVKKHQRAVLFFPNADKLFTGQATPDLKQDFPNSGKISLTFKAAPPVGTYQYAIYWEDNNGKGQFAEGDSPPEVIIY